MQKLSDQQQQQLYFYLHSRLLRSSNSWNGLGRFQKNPLQRVQSSNGLPSTYPRYNPPSGGFQKEIIGASGIVATYSIAKHQDTTKNRKQEHECSGHFELVFWCNWRMRRLLSGFKCVNAESDVGWDKQVALDTCIETFRSEKWNLKDIILVYNF